ncbi:MAG: GNAT family N-acetyltransferase [Opitutaceae bacterium]|nr:GNAT family N-acetyltransferase [Opitutaceae bacterium]MBP9914075.1 GNAT family N-acetyltransferase [Opitutaceae bacterium]
MAKTLHIVRAVELDPALAGFLSLCIGNATEEKIKALWVDYTTADNRELWSALLGPQKIGLVGFEIKDQARVIIRHITVAPEARRKGLGKKLIEHFISRYPSHAVEAETDQDAVGFYIRCGFVATSLGERYPGCERFRCTKQPSE